ncbi:MAG: hypothetical protein INF43_02095 [Alphaproteobacteria bacterium]|jgi:hypothetical protein|nr:hypothetical protein [Alphaproteobacteria bacterium]
MELWAPVLLTVFGVSAFILGLMAWWGGRWVRVLACILLLPWLYYGQWYGRVLWDIRLIDDAHSLAMQDSILAAIHRGEERLPLAAVTPFAWHAVCEVWAGQDYRDHAELQKVFGPHHPVSLAAADPWADHPYPLFATPQGPYLLQPFFGRFTEGFQNLWRGRTYRQALGGKGYVVELEFAAKPEDSSAQVCFTAEEAWVRIYPEPHWVQEINTKF